MKTKDIKKEEKDGHINKLKRRIRRLEQENKKLKAELNSFESAYRETKKFLRDNTDDIDLTDLLQAARSKKSLKQVQEESVVECPECKSINYAKVKTRFGYVCSCPDCGHREMVRGVSE